MHNIAFGVSLFGLIVASVVHPRYVHFAAVGCAVVVFSWAYFSLRRPGGMKGDASLGAIMIVMLVLVGALVFANSAVDDPVRVQGQVTGCIATTQRLTGQNRIVCSATVDRSVVVNFEAGGLMPAGTVVAIDRYPRRIVGYRYEHASRPEQIE